MKRLIIKNVDLNGIQTNILIKGAWIEKIAPADVDLGEAEKVIDGSGKAVFPGFVNCHTHAAMTLFRGYGDDMPLMEWLTTKIWPNEAHLDEEIIYWGSRLACLEMIKSGTTCFNDMYFFVKQAGQAVIDSGLRGVLQSAVIGNDMAAIKASHEELERLSVEYGKATEEGDVPVQVAVAPHAIYTVGPDTLRWLSDFAKEHDFLLHIHLSETEQEVNDCLRDYGVRPAVHLDKLGLLRRETIAAHGVWFNDEEIKLLGERGVSICHNPNSNLKLGSGHQFMLTELQEAGANICLGTDGCSSSNNLDMIEATKVMALLQKGWRRDTSTVPVKTALEIATKNGAQALRINAGEVKEGKLADLILVDLNNLAFVPNNNTESNLIYAAHGDCVDTTICGGRVVMEGRRVKDEEEIIRQARRLVKKLITI